MAKFIKITGWANKVHFLSQKNFISAEYNPNIKENNKYILELYFTNQYHFSLLIENIEIIENFFKKLESYTGVVTINHDRDK